MQLFGFTEAAISTVEHDVHRVRRGAMSRMFSKDSVRRLEPIMRENLGKLFGRLQEVKAVGKELNLLPVYSAFTNDLIAEYAFGISYNWLEAEEFNKSFFEMVCAISETLVLLDLLFSKIANFSQITSFHEVGSLAVQFNWVIPLINSMPIWLLRKLEPGMVSFLEFKGVRYSMAHVNLTLKIFGLNRF